jgi:hypothetical protein
LLNRDSNIFIMPLIETEPLKGCCLPDYAGGSIVNLMASIIRAAGGASPHAPLRGCPIERMAGTEKIVYLVLDGLGAAQLEQHLKQGQGQAFFDRHERQTISTVFPATTAAAVTTFATGAAPAEHGVLSWYLHLPDLGLVSTTLFCSTRTGVPMVLPDFDLNRYFDWPVYLDSTRYRRLLLTYGSIGHSRYSMSGTQWDERHAHNTLRGLARHISAVARRHEPTLAYAYWPLYDTLCHEYGCTSRQIRQHFDELDAHLGRLADRLQGTGTCLFVLSDHGLVDTPHTHRIVLNDIPAWQDCQAILPSGDARQVSCFIRPACVSTFLKLVDRHLAKTCWCVPGQQLLDMQVYGYATPHRALSQRIGDYVLVARPGYAFAYPPAGFTAKFNIGNHGGMSPEEVQIPLYVIDGR